MDHIKIVVEKHEDGFVAYPVGMKGIIVGEGDTFEEAFNDAKSAAKFHIETFGDEDFIEYAPQEVFVIEAVI